MNENELGGLNQQILDLTNRLIDISQKQIETASENNKKSNDTTRNIMKMFCITLVVIGFLWCISSTITECYKANQMYDYDMTVENTNKNDNKNMNEGE